MADKPRGHPPLVEGDHTTPVTIRIPTRLYKRACQQANQERVKVPEVIRRALARYVHETADEA